MNSNMELQYDKQKEQKGRTCYFCRPESHQIRVVLKSALRGLQNLNSSRKIKIMIAETVTVPDNSFSIQRLLKMLFERHQFQLTLSRNCKHIHLLNLFRVKFSCSYEEIEQLIDDLCDEMARRNYELEVLTMQIKNVEETICHLEDPPELALDKKQSSVEEQRESQEMVKVEQPCKPIDGTQANVSPKDFTFDNAFENMSFQYNMLFYNGLFYHQ